MTDKVNKSLSFGDTPKFITDELGLKGCVVCAMFEDGRIGIANDGLTGQQVQDLLAGGIYINQRNITEATKAAKVSKAVKQ